MTLGDILVPHQQADALEIEFADQFGEGVVRLAHAFCFSLQVMQTRVQGIAFNRASAIGSPQSRADAEGAFFDPHQRLVDRLENLGVGLLQPQLNMNFVVARGLIGHVALAAVVVLHRIWRAA